MLLHGLLAMVIPNLKFDETKTPDTLQIELVKKPEPPPVVEPPPPEPVKPKVEPKLQPIAKPLPKPTVVKNEPVEQSPPPPPPTEVIAVAPKVDVPPSPVPPAPVVVPEPPRPPAPSQADMDEARGKYGNALWGAISKEKKYPKIAQMRGWQGEAKVELLLDGSGKLKSKKIIQSSGYDILDKQALEMVEKAAPYPIPPEILRDSNFTITVPIPFKLE